MSGYYEGNPPPHQVATPGDQPTAMPSDKVAFAGAGGAIATIVMWLVQTVTEIEPAPGLEAAIAVLVATVFAYFKRETGNLHQP